MSIRDKLERILSISEECIDLDDLHSLIMNNIPLVAYDGFEPSGRIHIAQGVMRTINTNKLTKSGAKFNFWIADWFAMLNNKSGGDLKKIPADDLLMIFDDVPSSSVSAEALNQGIPLSELLVSSGLTSSKSEATRLIRSGGIYVNERRVTNEKERLIASEAIDGLLFVLRKGAKQKHIVKILSE